MRTLITLMLFSSGLQAQIVKSYVKYFTTASYRNSEGDIIVKTNGTYYVAWTQFRNATQDNATADIAAKYSTDSGKNWVDVGIIQENIGAQTTISVSLVRISSTVVHMYFCVKNSNTDLRIFRKVSTDDCSTWGSATEVINDGGYMPMLNGVVRKTASGRIVVPVYYSADVGIIPPYMYVYCWYSDDNGVSWTKSTPNLTHNGSIGYAEPGFTETSAGNLLIYLRNETGVQDFANSTDNSTTFGTPYVSTLSSTHSPAKIIQLSNGHLIAFHNPSGLSTARYAIRVSRSNDVGATWTKLMDLEYGPSNYNFSYPSAIEYNGKLLVTYWETNISVGKISLKFASIPISQL